MKNFKLLFLSATLLGGVTVHAGLFNLAGVDCGDAVNGYEYNAFVFGDHTALSGDAEGRLAVGGNASYVSTYSVGQAGFGVGSQNVQSYGARDDLVVAGNLAVSRGSMSVNYGNTAIGGSITSGGVTTINGSGNTIDSGVSSLSVDFASAEQNLRALSADLAELAATDEVAGAGWALTYAAKGQDVAVFNVDASLWSGGHGHYFEYDDGATVIINLIGDGETVLDLNCHSCYINGTLAGGNGSYSLGAEDLLFNFVGISEINMTGTGLSGSLLATDSHLNLSGGGINGQTVVASATQSNGGEFHNFTFDDTNLSESIPEPMVASFVGLFGLGMLIVKRFFK